MKIDGNSFQSVSQASHANQASSSSAFKQKSPQTVSKQGEVSTLASEGQKTNLPKNLTQLDAAPNGADPAKQKHKKFSFKHMLGLKSNKHHATAQTNNAAQQASTSRPSTKQHPVSADVNLSQSARDELKNAANKTTPERTKGKSFTSKLAHGLGFKHSKLQSSSGEHTKPAKAEASTSQNTPSNTNSGHQRATLGGLFKEDPFTNKASIGPSGTPFREHGEQTESLSQAAKFANTLSPTQLEQPSVEAPVDDDFEEDPEVTAHFQAFQARKQTLETIPEGENEGIDEDDLSTPSSLSDVSPDVSSDDSDSDIEEDPEVSAHLQAYQARNQTLATIPEGENEGFDEDDITNTPDNSDSSGSLEHDAPFARRAGKEPVSDSELTTLESGESPHTSSAGGSGSPTANDLSRRDSSLSSTGATQGSDTPQTGPIKGVEMSLDKGKVVLSSENLPALNTLLKETLGRPSQSYVAHESHQDNLNQLLLDKQGRVFQVATDPNMGILALHTSAPMLSAEKPPESLAGYLKQAGQNVIDNGYRPVATGVHSDNSGNHWRLHEGKLHSLVELSELEELSGIQVWQQEDASVSKLSMENGTVMGLKDKHQVVNLTTNQSTPKLEPEIKSFSSNYDGKVALLVKSDGAYSLNMLPKLESSKAETQNVALKYDSPLRQRDSVRLKEIHITNDRFFAINNENKLLSAPLPKAGQTEMRLTELPQAELQNVLGKDAKLEGFTTHKDDSLSLLVRDHNNQLHGCPANDASGKTFKPGWNLSDTLSLSNTTGLELFDESAMQEQDFGTLGTFALENGNLYSKDKLTQQWTKVGDKIAGLQRGLDDQAYALQDGKLKKITVDDSSKKIGFGEDNVFALTQTHGKTSLSSGPSGLPEGKLIAAAVIDPYQHVTLSQSGKLQYSHIRPGSSKPMHPPREIGMQGLDGNIQHLSIDRDHKLFAMTDTGKLFSLAKNDWQALPKADRSTPPWKEEKSELFASNMQNASLSLTKNHQLEITTEANAKFAKSEDGWEDATPKADANTMRDKFFNNLVRATKGAKLSKDGVQYTMTAQLGGVMGMESNKVSSKFTDRLKAHVFKPSLEMPRPVKVAAYNVQHQWQGREGLKALYEQEGALYKALESNNANIKSNSLPERNNMDVKTRIDRLNLGASGEAFKAELESLRKEIESSAEKQLIQLGRHQGVLQDNNAAELNLDYKPSKIKDAVQSLNPNRSGHNLSEEVLTSWKRNPASSDSNVSALLKAFTELNVNMSHQKTEIPAGRMRDPNDEMALSKARLVLDTLTLQKLDSLVDKAELLSGKEPDERQIKTLHQNLSELRDVSYENHRVKHYTDKGMVNHKDVEATYDIAKSFIKGFSDPDNGVSVITRAVFENKDQSELNQSLKDLMHSLKPNDSITISRGYSGGASATFIPNSLQNKPVVMFPTAGVETKRGYDIEINGLEDGIEVAFKGNLAKGGNANFGISKNALPHLMGDNANNVPIAVDDHHNFTPDLAAGVGMTISSATATQNELKLNLRGQSIDTFVDGLTSGKITPEDLIDIGMEHTNVHGNKWNFNVDLALGLAARARVDVADSDNNPSVIARLGGGLTAGLNVFSMSHDDLRYQSLESSRQRVNRTDGFLNSASAGIDGAFTFGTNLSKTEGDLVMYPNVRAAATVGVDNSVKVRGELKSKPSSEVDGKAMGSLQSKLSEAFQDPISQQVLQGVGELTDVEEQLKVLDDHFLSGNFEETMPQNDEQHAAINSIKSTQIQHLAAKNGVDLMSDIKGVVSHANPHQLDHPGVLNFITSLIAPSQKDALSSQISTMMKEDPNFAAMINDIRSKPNTYTWVTLQLKDEPRLKLEKDFVEGKVTLEEAQKLLADPEQRRIKSISILETGQHREGFNAPTLFLAGGSNATVYMEREAGVINFSYGQDQDKPRNYTITGGFTEAKPDLASAIQDLKESEGLSLTP